MPFQQAQRHRHPPEKCLHVEHGKPRPSCVLQDCHYEEDERNVISASSLVDVKLACGAAADTPRKPPRSQSAVQRHESEDTIALPFLFTLTRGKSNATPFPVSW